MKRLAVLLAASVAACSSSGEEQPSNSMALVAVAPVTTGGVQRTIKAFGAADASASDSRAVSAPIDAIVVSVDAVAGSRIGAGQMIARLRPTPSSQLELSRAISEASAANSAYARTVRLERDGLASKADVDNSRATAAAANATVSSLRQRFGSIVLRSSVSGIVTTVAVEPGATVTAGTSVATVTRSDANRARFGVSAAVARAVLPGSAVQVSAGGQSFTVPIISVDPVVDPETKLASVYATLPDQARLGVGEPLGGELVLPESGGGLVVPYAAVLDDGGQPYVFVVARRIVHRRNIRLGAVSSNWASVLSGLKAGEIVVTAGGTALEDGMRVRTR